MAASSDTLFWCLWASAGWVVPAGTPMKCSVVSATSRIPAGGAEVEDGVGVHTMARVNLIENNVQYRVAGTVDQLQALVDVRVHDDGHARDEYEDRRHWYGAIIPAPMVGELVLTPPNHRPTHQHAGMSYSELIGGTNVLRSNWRLPSA
ncbi:hypothetical protein F5883DRAFT_31626 [Diaporthe sp. PMI_573]|nr:hypothetical protein F5883DRAFT_31626 [Diaporthaceae sp. PMI_573]